MADTSSSASLRASPTTAVSTIGSRVMRTHSLVGALGAAVGASRRPPATATKAHHSAINSFPDRSCIAAVFLALTALLLALPQGYRLRNPTPEEVVQGTLAYLTVCFIGIPFITAYNIIASIFRGLGDSNSPMYFIAVACVVNIALDYYFMGTLHLGPRARRPAARRR